MIRLLCPFSTALRRLDVGVREEAYRSLHTATISSAESCAYRYRVF